MEMSESKSANVGWVCKVRAVQVLMALRQGRCSHPLCVLSRSSRDSLEADSFGATAMPTKDLVK